MTNKTIKCLLELSEDQQTKTNAVTRLKTISNTVNRIAGILTNLTERRLSTNSSYWKVTLEGWGDHLQLLSNELRLIQSILLKDQIET